MEGGRDQCHRDQAIHSGNPCVVLVAPALINGLSHRPWCIAASVIFLAEDRKSMAVMLPCRCSFPALPKVCQRFG